MKHPQTTSAFIALILLSGAMTACSDSKDSQPEARESQPTADTSYLDQLAEKQGIEVEDDPEVVEPPVTEIVNSSKSSDEVASSSEDEEREWEHERESQSLLGRSRDKAKDLRDQLQGSTTPENGIAYTLSDEEYAASSGLRWEMPDGWSMAVPARGRFAEMYITNRLGNASVSFAKESDTTINLIKQLQAQIVDPMGGKSKARTETKTVAGKSVTIADLEGTYLDPGSKGGSKEQIFYAMHAAIFDLGDSRILIKVWGPQDTVNQNIQAFDSMINETSQQ